MAIAVPGTPCVGPDQGPQPAYVLSPTATDLARSFTAQDADTLASLGFNTVRLGVVWEGLEPGPSNVGINDPVYCAPHRSGQRFASLGSADPYDAATVQAYLARTEAIVAELAQAGLRVVIDMNPAALPTAGPSCSGSPSRCASLGSPWPSTCTGRSHRRRRSRGSARPADPAALPEPGPRARRPVPVGHGRAARPPVV